MTLREGDLVRGEFYFGGVADFEFEQEELAVGIDQDIGNTQRRPTF